MEFRFQRPKKGLDKGLFHSKTPDVDKLARSILDAAQKVVVDDDCMVVDIRARKVYASPDQPIGVFIVISHADEDDWIGNTYEGDVQVGLSEGAG